MTQIKLQAASFGTHFNELRKRILYCFLFFIVACVLASFFRIDILNILLRPLAKAMSETDATNRLIYTGVAEGFITALKVCLMGGVILSLPFFGFQLYAFVKPALFPHERQAIYAFLLVAPLLFIIGILFAYFLVLPMAYVFFLDFQTMHTLLPIQLEAKVSEYLSLIQSLLMAFGIAFEMPLVLVLMGKAGLITASALMKFRRYAIILIFIVAAILTPPDIISQICLALPLLVLYELSICLLKRP